MIPLPRSRSAWQLYDLPGAGTAAREMTRTLAEALRAPGATRDSVYAAVDPVFSRHRRLGACDSEPLGILDTIMRDRFGRD